MFGSMRQKVAYPLKFFCHFLNNRSEVLSFTRLLPVHSHAKLPKSISLSVTATKLLNFSVTTSSFLVFSCSRMCCRKKRYHSNNIINNLSMTENSKCPPPAFTHAFNLSVKFSTALLMTIKLSKITCLSSATDFTFGEKLSINTVRN